jgi:D-xylose 1-dehydrogenase (NADP+, D-xylono-1,5-lactone-forming)
LISFTTVVVEPIVPFFQMMFMFRRDARVWNVLENMMSERLRWGILGTGNIARQFCAGVLAAEKSVLTGVGSRSKESAEHFAGSFRIAASYDSYEKLLADPGIDAVYNSLPNSLHHRWTIAALEAGKHVLCEKPFAVNVAEATEMFEAARRHGRVVVEAFMYRCHPLIHAVKQSIDSGSIGELKMIRSSFCYRTTKIAGNVRFDQGLAGGSLMDVGCYCVNFSRHFAGGEPTRVNALAHFHQSGVDDRVVATMEFGNGVLAGFGCGMSSQADNTATLSGTEGYIEIPVPWKPPAAESTFVIARGIPPKMDGPSEGPSKGRGKDPAPRETIQVQARGELYGIEADAFADCVLHGKEPWISSADTLGNTRVLEMMQQQMRQSI